MSESAVPPRKRRRPALSCVECRRRKIKCDRNVPCTQCTQFKSASCTYKDGYPGSSNSHTAKPAPQAPSAPQNGDLGCVGHIVPFVPGVSASAGQNASPKESSARTVPLFNESHSAATTLYSPSASVGSPEEPQSEQNVQVLLDRVKKLEDSLNTVSPGNLDPLWTSFSSNDNQTFFGRATKIPVPELKGSVSKTRLFGQSHWMCAFEHVGYRMASTSLLWC
jgi:hypothetical protein